MGVNLFGGKFKRCEDADGRVLNASEVWNKSQCEEMNVSHNYSWNNPKINFDNVLTGYLALFQVVGTLIIKDLYLSNENTSIGTIERC